MLGLLVWSSTPCMAAPKWVEELGPGQPGKHPRLEAGELVFSLSWKGILNSGQVSLDIGKAGAHKPGVVVIQTESKTMGPGGAIFPYQGHGWSEINLHSLRPRYLKTTENKDGKHVETENRFFSNRVTYKRTTTQEEKRWVKSHVFAQSPVHDIGSAILFIRSQKLDPGDQIKLMLHPYSSPYLLTAKVVGRVKHKEVDCIQLSLELSKIDLKTLKLRPYKKLKEPASLWLSDDQQRLPLELRSKIFVGDVRVVLEAYNKA